MGDPPEECPHFCTGNSTAVQKIGDARHGLLPFWASNLRLATCSDVAPPAPPIDPSLRDPRHRHGLAIALMCDTTCSGCTGIVADNRDRESLPSTTPVHAVELIVRKTERLHVILQHELEASYTVHALSDPSRPNSHSQTASRDFRNQFGERR